jgi:hypothetical protein
MAIRRLLLTLFVCAAWEGAPRAAANSVDLDLALGPSFAIGGDDWRRFTNANFAASGRIAFPFWLSRQIGIGPELDLDGATVITMPPSVAGVQIDASFGRLRALLGVRVVVRAGAFSLFVRGALGVDYISGHESAALGTLGATVHLTSTALSIEPGIGVEWSPAPHFALGLSIAFPIGVNHRFADSGNSYGNQFTAADLELLPFIGGRF